MDMRVAIDTGGTFTDIILYDEKSDDFCLAKIPSHPENPESPFIEGLLKVLKIAEKNLREVKEIRHGTTLVTNALLEGKTAKVGLLVTKGFRDLLEIGRQQRPSLYDLTKERLTPLVPRDCVLEITERVSSEGKVITPLDEVNAQIQIADFIKKKRIHALAVSLLFSFFHPEHERALEKLAQKKINPRFIFLSSQVSPEFREFERTSTTVVAAAVAPGILSYLRSIQDELSDKASPHYHLGIMHSGGGILNTEEAEKRPHTLIESGPAAGVIGAAHLARWLNLDRAIAFDMGGTSAKAGMILDGKLQFSQEYEVGGELHHGGRQRGNGYPIRTPMIDVVECGAGAGSVAWIDKGGHLKVGPHSAGAEPGPACYGKGGADPTVTDAHLVLGRITADKFLGGEMALYPKLSEKAIKRKISHPLNLTLEEAASGILDIANASMLRILRLLSVMRGHDPRDFTLIAYGGAGPLHATELAEMMSIKHIIIPRIPGFFSTLGLFYANLNTDFVETAMIHLTTPNALNRIISRLQKQADAWFKQNEVSPRQKRIKISADIRYSNQSHELNLPLPETALIMKDMLSLQKEFHKIHAKTYGLSSPGESIQIVNVRLRAIKLLPRHEMPAYDSPGSSAVKEPKKRQTVWIKNEKWDCPFYERSRLRRGERIEGPAVIQENESTTLVMPGWHLRVDKSGNLHIQH
jgi:N-methylhydantoinase A